MKVLNNFIKCFLLSFIIVGVLGLSQCIIYDANWEYYANNIILISTCVIVYMATLLIIQNLKAK